MSNYERGFRDAVCKRESAENLIDDENSALDYAVGFSDGQGVGPFDLGARDATEGRESDPPQTTGPYAEYRVRRYLLGYKKGLESLWQSSTW